MATPVRFLTGMVLLVFSFCALAQSDTEAQQADAADPAIALEPVKVTGYHIKRIDLEGPAPVVVFDRADLERAGINTLKEFARNLPLNWGPMSDALSLLYGRPIGAAQFNLRGIGLDSTLTLVNGLRIAPFAQFGDAIIDINAIPVTAIDRIEILKDGASAIYGAEAIAGVVNIILRTDYDGIEVSAGYGITEHSDNEEILADLVAGRDNGRGSVMFSLSYYDRTIIFSRDREWASDPDFSAIGGPNFRSSRSSPPTLLRYDTFQWEADPDCGTDPLLSSVGPFRGGTACWFNYNQFASLTKGLERLSASLSARYEIKGDLSLFGDVLFSNTEGEAQQAPAPVQGSPMIETFTGLPYVPADHPNNPFGTDGELRARPLDMGNRIYIDDTTAYRIVIGLEGLWGRWDWQASALVSENEVEGRGLNSVRQTRLQQALLGQGGPNGDQYYNPFGFEPQNDPALLDWLEITAVRKDTSDERSIDVLFSSWFGALPGGPVGIALGLQYREQDLEQWADEHLQSGDLAGGSLVSPVSAGRTIGSAYVEFNLPLLDSVEAQLALRYEHYDDFGSTTNPKIALRWQPLDSLMFRGSYGTSFRPPSFIELYAPLQQNIGFYIDEVRCPITGLPQDCGWWEYTHQFSGNPDLEPEEGESWFGGMVWSPDFLPGFDFELDFWKFRHENRIVILDGQVVLDEGGDFGIIRAPPEADGTPGRIIRVEETQVNTDELLTQGFDTTMRYSWQTDRAGDFLASLIHTYIDRYEFTDTIIWFLDQGKNYAGKYIDFAIPRNRANVNFSWNRGQHGAAANIHYAGHYRNWDNQYVDGELSDEPWIIPSHTTLDLQYSYIFERLKQATLRIGCINCSGEDPPYTSYTDPEPFHDLRDRLYYLRWLQPIR
jgi:outer membrane receptor protein involved in Fe transport